MGRVSSGLQGGPLRGKSGRPVADPDEATGEPPARRGLEEEHVTLDDLERDGGS